MGESNDYIITWEIKNFSKYSLENLKYLKTSTTNTLDTTIWSLLLKGDGSNKSVEYFSCFVYALKGFFNMKNLTKIDLFVELIGGKNYTICSKEKKNCNFEVLEFYGWKDFIKVEELRNYFENADEDDLTLRCSITGMNNGYDLRMGIVSYLWEINTCDLSCDYLFKEFSVSDLFPFKAYLIKIEDEIVIKPQLSSAAPKSSSCRISLYDENFQKSNEDGYCYLKNDTKMLKMKDFVSKLKSEENKMFLRCDAIVRIGEPKTGEENTSPDDSILTLLNDLKKAPLRQIRCDVDLRVDGKVIPAHKRILAARSPIFSAMFDQDDAKANSGIVDIPDCKWEVFKGFLQFLYTGEFNDKDYQNVSELLMTADKYQVSTLTEKCSATLKSLLTDGNVCEVLVVADLVNDPGLKTSAMSFFVDNAEEITESSKWLQWADSYPDLAEQVYGNLPKNCGKNVRKKFKSLKN